MMDNQEVSYASFNKRLTAAAIDLFVLLILLMPIMEVVTALIFKDRHINVLLNELNQQVGDDNLVTGSMIIEKLWEEKFFHNYALVQLIALLFMGLYTIGFWIFNNGATLGKWACACRVVDNRMLMQITYQQAILRCLSYIISTLPLGLGFIAIAITNNKIGLHDKISGTVVINFKHEFKLFEKIRNRLLKNIDNN